MSFLKEIETKIKVNSKLYDDNDLNKVAIGLKKPIKPIDMKIIAIEAVILFNFSNFYNLLNECLRYP